jgi:hypothetical protein
MALATTQKGSSIVAEFFTKMKGLDDEMASAGKKLDDDELVSHILMGLGEEFDSMVIGVSNLVDPISLQEIQAQLVSHEQRRKIHDGGFHSSVNIAAKGGRGGANFSNNRGGTSRGGGGRGSSGHGHNGGGRGRGRNFSNRCSLSDLRQ